MRPLKGIKLAVRSIRQLRPFVEQVKQSRTKGRLRPFFCREQFGPVAQLVRAVRS